MENPSRRWRGRTFYNSNYQKQNRRQPRKNEHLDDASKQARLLLDKLLRCYHHRAVIESIIVEPQRAYGSLQQAARSLDQAFRPAFASDKLLQDLQAANVAHIESSLLKILTHYDAATEESENLLRQLCNDKGPPDLASVARQVIHHVGLRCKLDASTVSKFLDRLNSLSNDPSVIDLLATPAAAAPTMTSVEESQPRQEGTDFWNLDDESTVSLNNFFLQKNQADRLESFLAKEVAPLAYRHSSASGRPEPRLIAWFGPDYSYSGRQLRSNGPIPSGLQPLLESVETATGKRFNSVLVNVYQNGSQFVGWHADDEAVLGERPFIASVSIGCTRTFELKAKSATSPCLSLDLFHGSLLTMSGDCQANFFHRIPPQHHKRGRRFNLTFRWTHEDPNTGATGASLAPSAPSATKTATPNTAVPLTASMAPVDLDESAQSAEHRRIPEVVCSNNDTTTASTIAASSNEPTASTSTETNADSVVDGGATTIGDVAASADATISNDPSAAAGAASDGSPAAGGTTEVASPENGCTSAADDLFVTPPLPRVGLPASPAKRRLPSPDSEDSPGGPERHRPHLNDSPSTFEQPVSLIISRDCRNLVLCPKPFEGLKLPAITEVHEYSLSALPSLLRSAALRNRQCAQSTVLVLPDELLSTDHWRELLSEAIDLLRADSLTRKILLVPSFASGEELTQSLSKKLSPVTLIASPPLKPIVSFSAPDFILALASWLRTLN
ncbi:hypothetical protein BOX15_Mlig007645g3 [Macrostomum lignano]|uniref:Fe2OG dioxygenase domain-containing protein n=1 Tax=Macrostomum lignano TaxID=282301 RepID=A0A267ELJ7_9PLAT|nr:hypothetical protein BOX15_Mlig007645g3 [Macrostomum lignano]